MDPVATIAFQSGKGDTTQVLIWVGVLIGLVILSFVVVMMVRRRLFAKDDAISHTAGLMESLREMRDSGTMTQEEYDAVKRRMAARISSSKAPASLEPRPPDRGPPGPIRTESRGNPPGPNVPPPEGTPYQ